MTDSTPSWVRHAKAGDKVVCISTGLWSILRVDEEYTIRAIFLAKGFSIDFNLWEFKTDSDRKPHFQSFRFRPLQTLKSTSKAVAEIKRLSGVAGKVDA